MTELLTGLKRNDIEGALRVARKLMKDKKWLPEDGEVLLMLQDNPEELDGKLLQLMEEMGVEI